ncbi:MAG: alpha/beta hydrolase [Acidimicrobiia bacterium]|nr:MAG: alpha/beta hydrolase [Acidimicrobiia bacterium]
MFIDPALFRDDAVSEETRAFNAGLQELLLAQPDTSLFTPDQIRSARREGKTWLGPVVYSDYAETITIDGPGGDLDLRVITAGEAAGVYLHMHGGGWVLGAADLSDVPNEAMAIAAGVTVVSVDYRLAPEYPYPAGVDDCAAAAAWLVENGEDSFGTNRFAIGGESAGANLVAATLLKTRDDVGYVDWAAANLVYGSYLPHGTPSVRHWNEEGLVLEADTMTWFGKHYVGEAKVAMDDPYFSPLYGELHDMPPALFSVGTWDPLLDDTLFMAVRWLAAENHTELAIYPGGVHAFDAFPTQIAIDARTRMHAFIRDAVTSPATPGT